MIGSSEKNTVHQAVRCVETNVLETNKNIGYQESSVLLPESNVPISLGESLPI